MPNTDDKINMLEKGVKAGLLFGSVALLASRVRIAKPNQILAITGFGTKGSSSGVQLSRKAIVWPVIQQMERVELNARQFNFAVHGTSNDMLEVHANFSITVRPDDGNTEALTSYIKYLNGNGDKLSQSFTTEQSMGAIRGCMAHMGAKEIFQGEGRDQLLGQVSGKFDSWLRELGLKIVALSITNIGDPPKEKGISGFFKILEEAKLAEARADSIVRQCVAQETEAKASSERDIKIAELKRNAGVAKATHEAVVSKKEQEVALTVELARNETETAKKRAELVPSATAKKEAVILEAEAKKEAMEITARGALSASQKAAESYQQLLAGGVDPQQAMLFYLHQTGLYGRYLQDVAVGMKDMKPNVNVSMIQPSGSTSSSEHSIAKTFTDLYAAGLPIGLQAATLFGSRQVSDSKSHESLGSVSVARVQPK